MLVISLELYKNHSWICWIYLPWLPCWLPDKAERFKACCFGFVLSQQWSPQSVTSFKTSRDEAETMKDKKMSSLIFSIILTFPDWSPVLMRRFCAYQFMLRNFIMCVISSWLNTSKASLSNKAFRRTFPYEAIVRGGRNYTLNLSFVITDHLKLVSGQKKFPKACGRPPKSAG